MNTCLVIDFFLCRSNWKDFIIPTLAICVPVFITLYITRRDRRDNARNRREDLEKYENDKSENRKRIQMVKKEQAEKTWHQFESCLGMTVITGKSHLITIEGLITQSSFEKSGTLAVVVLVNEHLQALLNLDYIELSLMFPDSKYLQYLNSIKILDRLYLELMDWKSSYRREHSIRNSAFDKALQEVFYEIERLRYDEHFDKVIINNLNLFNERYDQYTRIYTRESSQSAVKEVLELKKVFIDQRFMKLKGEYNYLHKIVLDLQKSITDLERLAEYSESTLVAIKSGMDTHLSVLHTIGDSLFLDSGRLV